MDIILQMAYIEDWSWMLEGRGTLGTEEQEAKKRRASKRSVERKRDGLLLWKKFSKQHGLVRLSFLTILLTVRFNTLTYTGRFR
jgi:hypothetical protein